jgi:error-prone DNA polymerase
MGFTHLNLASAYSAHYGVNRPEQLAAAASALGFEALAVTDRDGLYGAVKHIAACIREGIHPIVGVNLEIADMGGNPCSRPHLRKRLERYLQGNLTGSQLKGQGAKTQAGPR